MALDFTEGRQSYSKHTQLLAENHRYRALLPSEDGSTLLAVGDKDVCHSDSRRPAAAVAAAAVIAANHRRRCCTYHKLLCSVGMLADSLIGSRPFGSTATFPPRPVTLVHLSSSWQSLISVKGIAGKPSYTIAGELETSPETCNCVAACGNGQLIAAAVGKNVRIYASNPSGFHLLSNVQVRSTVLTAVAVLRVCWSCCTWVLFFSEH